MLPPPSKFDFVILCSAQQHKDDTTHFLEGVWNIVIKVSNNRHRLVTLVATALREQWGFAGMR